MRARIHVRRCTQASSLQCPYLLARVSPLNDGHYYGTQVAKMFLTWFNTSVYGSDTQEVIIIRSPKKQNMDLK
jgi:hypothetical protein